VDIRARTDRGSDEHGPVDLACSGTDRSGPTTRMERSEPLAGASKRPAPCQISIPKPVLVGTLGVRGHEEVPGYGQLRSPLVATKVPAGGHEKSSPLTEVST
jgi:hypothetical protein